MVLAQYLDGFEFDDLEKPLAIISVKLGDFDKMAQRKCPTIKGIFDKYKIFAKVPHPLRKFDEKHDGEVADPERPTIH